MIMNLNPGESICPYCENGKVTTTNKSIYCFVEDCSFCKGKGKLDWIEKVVGVKETNKPKFYYIKPQKKFSNLLSDWRKINV